ncbi:MAG: class I SAM-dependent methyltransferase [bacterium]|nr:class I SAM-dependent methyltransferase [bacterium]
MDFDRLNEPLATDAWGESCIAAAFDAAWDRELFGLELPTWRTSIVRLVQAAHQHFDGGRIRVADLGCGAAPYARHLLETGIEFEYHGYDHNGTVLQAACRRWEFRPHERVHLHRMDARRSRWPIEDDAFDVVIWDTTLRFCENVPQALAESARVCRGWIILGRTPIEQRAWCEPVHYYDMKTPSADWHFDRALLGELAAEHGLHLTTEVGCPDTHVLSRQPWPADLAIQPVPRLDRAFHEAYIRERVARIFAEHPGSWAVYGAGQHSRWLMTILPESLRRRVSHFVDDHAAEGYAIDGVAVVRPDTIDPNEHAGVLVSSDANEDGLCQRAVQWCGREESVHRLYVDLPAGPYDKIPPAHAAPVGAAPRHVASLTAAPS